MVISASDPSHRGSVIPHAALRRVVVLPDLRELDVDHSAAPPDDDPATPADVIRNLVAGQELERRRIARDLHDVVGQALTAVRLNLATLQRDAGTPRANAELRRSIALIDRAMSDVRDIAFDLRPAIIDDLGLVAAARWYLARQGRTVGYRTTFRAEAFRYRLDVEVEAACFSTLQEALTNIARHARATAVQVELCQSADELVLVVKDDGVGFDPRRARRNAGRRPSLGLIGATERVALLGGSLEVESRPGNGTRLSARFPRRGAAVGREPKR